MILIGTLCRKLKVINKRVFDFRGDLGAFV